MMIRNIDLRSEIGGEYMSKLEKYPSKLSKETNAWLEEYPEDNSTIRDEQHRGCDGWFKSNGWDKKWPLHYASFMADKE